jgi:ribokinase
VVGGANTDYLVRGTELPGPGDTAEGEEFQEGPGGKGANQAVAAARLGARVAFVGRVGADARGDTLVRALEAEGVDTRHVVRDAVAATGVALVQVGKGGEKQIHTAPGANRRLGTDDVHAASSLIRSARVVLLQFESPAETVEAVVALAHDAGALVVLDPAPPAAVSDDVLRRVSVIRPNAAEAEALTGVHVDQRNSAYRAAEQLLGRGVGAVVIQAGSEGDLLVWDDETGRRRDCFLPRLPVNAVDATGAGDAFAAALATVLAEGRPIDEAARVASAAAALATTRVGAQAALPRREEVEALLATTALPAE